MPKAEGSGPGQMVFGRSGGIRVFFFFKGLFLFRRRSREPQLRQATNQLP